MPSKRASRASPGATESESSGRWRSTPVDVPRSPVQWDGNRRRWREAHAAQSAPPSGQVEQVDGKRPVSRTQSQREQEHGEARAAIRDCAIRRDVRSQLNEAPPPALIHFERFDSNIRSTYHRRSCLNVQTSISSRTPLPLSFFIHTIITFEMGAWLSK